MKNKSYNPFKMWGSYLGAIIIPLLVYANASVSSVPSGLENFVNGITFFLFNSLTGIRFIFGIGIYIILGFLIGWGIHSLVRFLKNLK
jgi:hypothetical protein